MVKASPLMESKTEMKQKVSRADYENVGRRNQSSEGLEHLSSLQDHNRHPSEGMYRTR